MSELSPDARDLIAQARQGRPELLGPSAEQRAQLREKLAPLWAAGSVQPQAAGSWRWKLGSLAIVMSLGVLGWLYTRSSVEPVASAPPRATSDQHSRAMSEPSSSAQAGAAPDAVSVGISSANARGVEEPCARGLSLRAGVCAPLDGSPAAMVTSHGQPIAATRKAKRALASPAASRNLASQPSAASSAAAAHASKVPRGEEALTGASPGSPPLSAATTNEPKESGDEDLLDVTAVNGRRVQPARTATSERLPLKAAEERTPERAVQTDADPGPPSIDGELELLGAAQTALQKQRPSRALTLLQEHAFRFPTGAMVEERMAMQALALCALQRRHAAQTVLSNLEARGSQSQLLPRVRSQCGL